MKKVKYTLVILFLFVVLISAQDTPYFAVEFIKVKEGKMLETKYYYESNWKLLRDKALENGDIISYSIVFADEIEGFDADLMLTTVFKDKKQYKAAEEVFQKLISLHLPSDGPVLLNELKPDEFRENLFYMHGPTIFTSMN